jgi:hypothetical protein
LSSFYAEYEFENEDIYARESEEEMRWSNAIILSKQTTSEQQRQH